MQKAGNHPLLVEPGTPGEIQHVDPVELVILALLDQKPDRIRHRRIGGLLQHRKLGLGVTHSAT